MGGWAEKVRSKGGGGLHPQINNNSDTHKCVTKRLPRPCLVRHDSLARFDSFLWLNLEIYLLAIDLSATKKIINSKHCYNDEIILIFLYLISVSTPSLFMIRALTAKTEVITYNDH